jgi:hypothetical protein
MTAFLATLAILSTTYLLSCLLFTYFARREITEFIREFSGLVGIGEALLTVLFFCLTWPTFFLYSKK